MCVCVCIYIYIYGVGPVEFCYHRLEDNCSPYYVELCIEVDKISAERERDVMACHCGWCVVI